MAVHKAISGCHDLLLLSMRRRLRRADTTARLRAEDARATPQAAAQINSDVDLDGSSAKPERENDGKKGLSRINLRPGEDGGEANPCIWSVRAKVKARRKFPLSWPSIKTDFTTS